MLIISIEKNLPQGSKCSKIGIADCIVVSIYGNVLKCSSAKKWPDTIFLL